MAQKTVFLTGGARGLGAEIKSFLESAGYKIIAPSRQELDLTNPKGIQDYLVQNNPQADILINNAGENIISPLEDISLGHWQRTQDINLTAPFLLTQHFGEQMKTKKWGRIINISSIFSLISKAQRAPYTASKAALNGLTTTSAIELAPYGVLVNAIAPGFFKTELTSANNSPEQIKVLEQNVPLGRLGEPIEIARLINFLISEQNTYLTGQVLVIDGGYLSV
ncbi:MAG: SDR family oxidoreductase [SAR324 cluster bacterium]|nr:SDR family oxidoreductase [SAR324 cluster bacterium]